MKVFLDTNVLLHCKPLRLLEWATLGLGSEISVILLPTVLRELDQQKDQARGRIQKHAREVWKQLDVSRIEGSEPIVNIRASDADLIVRLVGLTPRPWDAHPNLDPTRSDDRFFGELLMYESHNIPSLLISRDRAALLRAAAFGISTRKAPEEWERSDSADERDVEISQLRSEIKTLRATAPDVDVSFSLADADGPLIERLQIILPRLRPSLTEELNVAVDHIERHLHQLFGSATSEHGRGAQWAPNDQWRNDVRKLLRGFPSWIRAASCWKRINVDVQNNGGAPAEDIDLHLEAPQGVRFIEAKEKEEQTLLRFFPKPTEPPVQKAERDLRGLFASQVLASQLPAYVDHLQTLGRPPGSRTVYVSKETPYLCHLSVGRIKHHFRTTFGVVIVVEKSFDRDGGAILSELTLGNSPELKKFALPFCIEEHDVGIEDALLICETHPVVADALLLAYGGNPRKD